MSKLDLPGAASRRNRAVKPAQEFDNMYLFSSTGHAASMYTMAHRLLRLV
jgi:hypothetical protein